MKMINQSYEQSSDCLTNNVIKTFNINPIKKLHIYFFHDLNENETKSNTTWARASTNTVS